MEDTHKTYLKISSSYFWPKIIKNIEWHKNFCLCCQQQKKPMNKQTLLAPFSHSGPIHADLFGPMIATDSNQNFSFASQMHLLSMLWSLQLPARMLKRWPMPFTVL